MGRNPVNVAILAGGKSTRLGENKALSKVGDQPIIERVMDRVKPIGTVFLVANEPDLYRHLDIPVFRDLLPGLGPLGGIYTALSVSSTDHVLVISCDLPFLNRQLLQHIIDRREGYDVVVPLGENNHPQGLHAVYARACFSSIEQQINAGQRKIIAFYPNVRVLKLSFEETAKIDPHHHSFINVNTPEDLRRARALAARIG
nr:molybdenum cofactor guanylyltransferase [Anaerolineae bacterium]